MKKTFGYKVAVAALWVLHVFGASALVVTILALCGVHMHWWIGALSVVPGWLIIRGLQWFFTYEHRKSQKKAVEEAKEEAKQELKEIFDEIMKEYAEEEQGTAEKPENKAEECRFNEDGQCTYSEEPMECVYPEGNLIQSCEDPNTVYIQEGDVRRILHEGKEVGWYRWE